MLMFCFRSAGTVPKMAVRTSGRAVGRSSTHRRMIVRSLASESKEEKNSTKGAEEGQAEQREEMENKNGPSEKAEEPLSREEERLRHRKALRDSFNKHVESGIVKQLMDVNNLQDLRVFPTSERIEPADDALTVPHLAIESLSGTTLTVPRKGRVTLLLLSFNQMGFDMLSTWREPVERHFQQLASPDGNKRKRGAKLQVVQLCIQENRLYTYIQRFLLPAFKKTIEPAKFDSVGAVYGAIDGLKDSLQISNVLVGYAFLVDPDGKVRWRGCGNCDFRDSMLLIESLSQLLDVPESSSVKKKT